MPRCNFSWRKLDVTSTHSLTQRVYPLLLKNDSLAWESHPVFYKHCTLLATPHVVYLLVPRFCPERHSLPSLLKFVPHGSPSSVPITIIQKPDSWTYNFVEVSGHNLKGAQAWPSRVRIFLHKSDPPWLGDLGTGKKIDFIYDWGRYSAFVFLANAEHTLKIM